MTPEQLKFAEAFKQVSFREDTEEKKFATNLIKIAKHKPTAELSAQDDAYMRVIAWRYRRMLPIELTLGDDKNSVMTLSWLAPELVKSSLIKNEIWACENAARAVGLFPNKSMHTCAAMLSALHEHAYDYIAQAPVLALVAMENRGTSKAIDRQYIAAKWEAEFTKGGKLRHLMARVGVPLPLRKLSATVIDSPMWPTIERLAKIDPSTLSQLIPDKEDQQSYLTRIGHWANHMNRRFQNSDLHFEWACRQLNPVNLRRLNIDVRDMLNQLGTIGDFAGYPDTGFNINMNIDNAMAAAVRWHTDLAAATQDRSFFMRHAMRYEDPIDYHPFPQGWTNRHYVFVALRSGQDLFEEGREMHHCVGSYSDAVITGRSRIYGMRDRDTGKRIATVEFAQGGGRFRPLQDDRVEDQFETIQQIGDRQYRPTWHYVQAKGPCNERVSEDAIKAITEFENRLNYYWSMHQHEKMRREHWEDHLTKVMLSPMPPMVFSRDEFPGIWERLELENRIPQGLEVIAPPPPPELMS